VALSVSCCVGAKVSVPDIDRSDKGSCRSRDPSDLRVCGLRSDRVERTARSCASAGDDPAEGVDIGFAGAIEGAELDEAVPPVSVFEEEAVLGESFLGQGLLCGHRGFGYGHDTQVCPLP